MDVVAAALLFAAAVKLWSIASAIHWISARGDAYRDGVRALRAQSGAPSASDYEHLRLSLGSDYLPLGFKDMKLRRWRDNATGAWRPRLLRAVVFAFFLPRLTLFVGVYVAVVAYVTSAHVDLTVASTQTVHVLCFLVAMTLLACALLMALEALWSYTTIGEYAGAFHGYALGASGAGRTLRAELGVLARCLAILVTAASSAVFVATTAWNEFTGVAHRAAGVPDFIDRAMHAVYFVSTTLSTVGYGDIHPQTALGRGLTVTIELGGFAFVALVLSVLLATRA